MTSAGDEADAELAKRAALGDDHAYSTLMRRHKGSLYGFARRYVGDTDTALEIVQETFVAAWKALGRYDARRPFAVWLRAIALNKCRDRGRRAAVRRLVFGEMDADSAEARGQGDPGPDPERSLILAQRRTAVDRAVARLPDRLKAPLILTQLDGLSQSEAARLLGITVKAVETRVYRARQRLMADLRRSDDEV